MIDNNIFDSIVVLNIKHYKTISSCESHGYTKGIREIYILFAKQYVFDSLPNKFYSLIYGGKTIIGYKPTDEFDKYNALQDLFAWASNLKYNS